MQKNIQSQNDCQAKIYRRMGMRRVPTAQTELQYTTIDKVEASNYWRRLVDPIVVDEVCRVIQLLRNCNRIKDGTENPIDQNSNEEVTDESCSNKYDCINGMTIDLIQLIENLLCHCVEEKSVNLKEQITYALDMFVRSKLSHVTLPSVDDAKKDIFILVIGMDGAGKSTLISTLKGNTRSPCRPTLGFCPTVMTYEEKCTVNLYDIGGGDKIRGIWKNYFHDVHGIIYVFDVSNASEKFEESIVVARQALGNNLLRNKPLLFICNRKCETEFRHSDFIHESILAKMNSYSITSIHETNLYNIRDESLAKIDDRVKWLILNVLEGYTELSQRIAIDTDAKAKRMDEEHQEKERMALKKMICKAFGVGGEGQVNTFSVSEGEEFLATELGLDTILIPKEAKEVAALVGYEKYALMIIGALACPVSRKKEAWSWSHIKAHVLRIREEVFSDLSDSSVSTIS